MISATDRFLRRWPRWTIIAVSIAITLLVVTIDDWTGPDVNVAVLYLVPVLLISWAIGRGGGLIAAVISAVIWSTLEMYPSAPHAGWWYVWNFSTRIGVFVAFALVVSRTKRDLDELTRVNTRLEEASMRVKQLSGLLPICSWCKKIRDGEGEWHQLEEYIAEHTDAGFSHGICPECARKIRHL